MISNESNISESKSLKRKYRSIPKTTDTKHDLVRNWEKFSPSSILAITVGGIILAEVIAMIFVYFIRDRSYVEQVVIDTTIMTMIIFPLLYFLLFKPLLLHIQQLSQIDSIISARLRLMQFANVHALDELLQFSLDEIENLTDSAISFFHFLETDQKTIRLQAWSTNTLHHMCKAEGKDSHYSIERAGVWADAVRHYRPIIHNNYAALPNRKGLPDGHALVTREMVIPVLRDNKVVAILGLGNKPQDYTANDLDIASTFSDFAWDVVVSKQADTALRQSEQKFRTLVDWTYDWEKWVDPQGNIVYTSPSCERITGYTPEEFISDPELLNRIVHPDDQLFYEEHKKIIHDELANPVRVEYRIISRDGKERWIEHICRPLLGPDNRYLGRRVSNREITERKQTEKKILEQTRNEIILTQTIRTIQNDIARDLHDTLGQNISFLSMNLEHLSETQWNEPTIVKNQIQNMTRVAKESYELIRTMLAILHFGTSTDLLSLFTHYAEQVADRSSFQINITSHGYANQLSPHQIRQLFYILREALSNIEKYANASQVSGEFLWNDHALTLIIADDGRGFDLDEVQTSGHYGLKFMRERAELLKGSFVVQSSPGRGTTIKVVVPYENEMESLPQ